MQNIKRILKTMQIFLPVKLMQAGSIICNIYISTKYYNADTRFSNKMQFNQYV